MLLGTSRVRLTLAGAALAAGSLAAGGAQAATSVQPAQVAHQAANDETPHWTYEGDEGPEHWGDLDPAYAACGTGRSQSPVDIRKTTRQDLPDLAFAYRSGTAAVVDTGHTIQVSPAAGNTMTDGDKSGELLQFHVHTPSEHTVGGRSLPGEIHFVHRLGDGRLSVVGVLVKRGPANPVLARILDAVPPRESSAATIADVAPGDLLPERRAYVAYQGSLTTPPCTDGVDWHVLTTPITASPEQLDRLTALMGRNNRPVQPLAGRTLLRDATRG